MYFKQFLHDELGCSSYFLASRQTRDALVVDPQHEVQPYLDLAHERGYRIAHVVDTHLHADHLSGNRALAAATGATLWLHEQADVLFPFSPLRDGDEIRLGQVAVRALHTPGHRPEAMSLLVTNHARSPEPSMVLSGDTLFVGDVGRPDFGGIEGARQQYDSTHRLLELPDYVEVFPAHFEGSCGKGMCGRPSSTVGFERRFNPLLQLGRADFVRTAAEVAARPLNMSAILAANRGERPYAWPAPAHHPEDLEVPTVATAEAPTWIAQHAPLVLDVREPSEFEAGHVPNALNIPQADLALRLVEVPPDREVLVVCHSGGRSRKAAQFLAQVGYRRVADLAGGTSAWADAGQPIERRASAPA